jgi:hypothetical protein
MLARLVRKVHPLQGESITPALKRREIPRQPLAGGLGTPDRPTAATTATDHLGAV